LSTGDKEIAAMVDEIKPGDCVIIPDGRTGRVRESTGGIYRVRVRRTTSQAHQFMEFPGKELTKTECPKGWMSPDGYNRYLKATLEKMRLRGHKS
jgi:hypothetical protein